MAASSESNGEVLYRTGQDSDVSDIWDDTALIEAYDRAVNIVKNGNFKSSGGNKGKGSGKNRKQNSKGNGNKKKDKGKSVQSMDSSSQWQVGERCSAVYTEDGEIYEAAIISINREYETCVVKYDSYDNVEEQYLKDLMQPFIKKSDKTSKDLDQGYHTVDSPYYPPRKDTETGMEWSSQTPTHSDEQWRVSDICLAPEYPSGHWHDAVINSFPTPCTCQVTFLRSRKSQQIDRSQLYHSNSSQHHHQPHHHQSHHHHYRPSGPPQWHQDTHIQWPRHPAHSAGNFSSYNQFSPPRPPPMMPHPGMLPPFPPSFNFCPPMPPVPPHPMTNATGQEDEALASMLMSWYLSGYYTGYYQGSQGFRQKPSQNPQSQPDTTNTLHVDEPQQCSEPHAPVNDEDEALQ